MYHEAMYQRFLIGSRAGVALLVACVDASALAAQTMRRAMTVPDVIQMATFGSHQAGLLERIDVSSPDGQLHAVVVKRGDIVQNTNVFSLLIFHSDRLFTAPKPDTILTLVSSSNRPAISDLKWLSDNRTLAFLGERPGELPQVYAVDVRTGQVAARTHHATEITRYDIAPSGDPVVYTARPPVDTSGYRSMRQHGFALRPTQSIHDVLKGAWYATVPTWSIADQFIVQHAGTAALLAGVPGPHYRACDTSSLSIAPSGRVALLQCRRARAPGIWSEYRDPDLAKWLSDGFVLAEFALLDLDRGTVTPLLETPLLAPSIGWSPSGEAVVLANVFLPLEGVGPAERRARSAHAGLVEVDVHTGQLTVIAHRDSLEVVAWDAVSNTVEFVASRWGAGRLDLPRVRYQKSGRGWREVEGGRVAGAPVLVVEQGLNQPPRLMAVDRVTDRRAVVLDPNPQLARLRLGREEVVHWRTRSGDARFGGLYYPPDFVEGQRYPLVIQTHGFDSTVFAPDGTFPTANAAQPIVGVGMLVLQIGAADDGTVNPQAGMRVQDAATPQEAPHAMEEIEGAIDHLDRLGVIDRSRVGLIGFSRTCFHVLYTLTHSHYPIAAAAITDGVDLSYVTYLLGRNAQLGAGYTVDEYARVNGGLPLGQTLELWRERAPGFNLDRVTTPLRLEAIGLPSVLGEWEPYAGLLLQQKPVELFVIPEGTHLLVKPSERLASSQNNLDWFRFWLKGEEDADPAKAEQYARWRELRKLQQQQPAADTGAAPQ